MITLNTLLDASVTAPLKKNGESNSFLEKKIALSIDPTHLLGG